MAAPVISSIVPTSGSPGDSLSINGTNLYNGVGSPVVNFGSTVVPPSQSSGTLVLATMPVLPAGNIQVSVTVDGLTSNTKTLLLNPINPTLTSYPTSIDPSQTGMIYGTNFAYISTPTVVYRNSNTLQQYPCTVLTSGTNMTQISFTLPTNIPDGNYTISVTNGTGGVVTSSLVTVSPYYFITKNIFADTGLSIDTIQQSTDGGTTWVDMPYQQVTPISWTARFRATMHNPNGLHNVAFNITVRPTNHVLASTVTNATSKTLTTAVTNPNAANPVSIDFSAALP